MPVAMEKERSPEMGHFWRLTGKTVKEKKLKMGGLFVKKRDSIGF